MGGVERREARGPAGDCCGIVRMGWGSWLHRMSCGGVLCAQEVALQFMGVVLSVSGPQRPGMGVGAGRNPVRGAQLGAWS